jgi:hypothetical protein
MWPESSRIASGVSVGKGQVALGGGGEGGGTLVPLQKYETRFDSNANIFALKHPEI